MNIFHYSVYYKNFEMVKIICELIPTLDVVKDGKIPKRTGLANDSEISIDQPNSQ
jgi:hypothetical protein